MYTHKTSLKTAVHPSGGLKTSSIPKSSMHFKGFPEKRE